MFVCFVEWSLLDNGLRRHRQVNDVAGQRCLFSRVQDPSDHLETTSFPRNLAIDRLGHRQPF